MTQTIFFVRHGRTLWNQTGRIQGTSDIPLSLEGVQQSETVTQRLIMLQPEVVVSSDLQRAVQTAKIISSELRLPFFESSMLRERDLGIFDGMTYQELTAERIRRGASTENPSLDWTCFPEVETDIQVANRVVTLLAEIVSKHKNPCLVTHAGVIHSFLSCFTELGKDANKIHIPTGSVCVCKQADSQFQFQELIK